MDNIDKAIKFCETGERPLEEDRVEGEPMKIYAAIETLRVNNTYYFLQFWINAKEFQRSKLTRSNFVPKAATDKDGENIEIEVHSTDEPFSESDVRQQELIETKTDEILGK